MEIVLGIAALGAVVLVIVRLLRRGGPASEEELAGLAVGSYPLLREDVGEELAEGALDPDEVPPWLENPDDE
jgi:hypothetical protein